MAAFNFKLDTPLNYANLSLLKGLVSQANCVPVVITGQQKEATPHHFAEFYRPAIDAAIAADDKKPFFFLGAADGVDNMAAAYLESINHREVAIFDKGQKDGSGALAKGWILVNGFVSYTQRDTYMLAMAKKLIAYLFENSGPSGALCNAMFFAAYQLETANIPLTLMAHVNTTLARILDRSTEHASEGWKLETSKLNANLSKEYELVMKAFVSNCFFGAEEFAIELPGLESEPPQKE